MVAKKKPAKKKTARKKLLGSVKRVHTTPAATGSQIKETLGIGKEKHPGGRPSKYRDEFCQIAVDLMEIGASKTEVCGTIGISFETLTDWTDKDSPRYVKEFSDSIKKGQVLSQCWWEKHGRTKLEERDFNGTLWYMNMKNRFRKAPEKWADKVEQEHTGGIEINKQSDEELDNRIKALMVASRED